MRTREQAAEALRAFIRDHVSGGCKLMSLGDGCLCLLCAVDELAAGTAPVYDNDFAPRMQTHPEDTERG